MIKDLLKEVFKEENIKKAYSLYDSNKQIASVNSEHLARLYKTKAGTVNFEFSVKRFFEGQMIEYIQPIGYYSFKRNKTPHITLLHEFHNIYKNLDFIRIKSFFKSITVSPLDLLENIIIGAVSAEAHIHSLKHQDISFKANNIEYDLIMTYDNEYPQCFLAKDLIKKTKIQEPLVAYLTNSIPPMQKFQAVYNDLINKELLTAYKVV